MGNEKIKILYIMTHCTKSGPIQQMLNLIKYLDPNVFRANLITIYNEDTNGLSLLNEYKKVIPHTFIPISKKEILLGKTKAIKKALDDFQPDIIHSFGVFPDYMITRIGYENHVLTSRNYIYEDYPDQYGKVVGTLLAWIHLYAIKHTKYACCCSESLHDIYLKRLGVDLPFIRNGVDISNFALPSENEKEQLKERFNLPLDKPTIVYGGVFNDRKNQEFLLKCVAGKKEFENFVFLLLGDGAEYSRLKEQYDKYKNIIMPGNTTEMSNYLKASDYYVSTSKSEGLPNGVLEAMACGLPVFLSDILQHREILNVNPECGSTYLAGDMNSFQDRFFAFMLRDKYFMSKSAFESVRNFFSAQIMSENYQKLYLKIANN